ncbi:MAG TPA: hypothetical protein VNJ87_00165 [Candidatus Macondimonas sp.]|nr:hypothetical protein [Candidatus Macondimonas sp.]
MRYEQLLHVERVVASYLYTDLTERAFEDVMDHYRAIAREQEERRRAGDQSAHEHRHRRKGGR